MLNIRLFNENDWDQLWQIMKPVFRSGETYVFAPDITKQEAYEAWIAAAREVYLVVEQDKILGTYYLRSNQPGLGGHVGNCGYIVSEHARGKGVASLMCAHSQQRAGELGYLAIQFNFVVSTNEGAIRLWQHHGFEIVGTLPNAYRHSQKGLVDVHVMYKLLD